ncbi:MAG TPA: type II toxin-antitoxin system prevent-host-death family antitoxin [Spirochaetota bacterium]|nr:type II toxin-antitoxin system prevent-host-death family antitoxin [Spirochaetota bacterium]HOS32205.1 type II toxin-antitoxin system prevent-host-death family antitoxin [Spirochaetota bacterium]HOS55650.1 type II toxin-antitoxin system prevent-host-death family antitoxin [Spirochaetota bacterium]HPK60923.1 type II toxin-antitoxin system prevent-host-death family antitoxin [Spirochaetota bacterium]HQF78174.1 type II toxin-antitoxin system prevent-host-death family antitoxin [Spirochaetota ba
MLEVTINEIQNDIDVFLSKIKNGEEIVIKDSNNPIAKLMPYKTSKNKRILGKENGKIWMSDDFDAPLPDSIIRDFYK